MENLRELPVVQNYHVSYCVSGALTMFSGQEKESLKDDVHAPARNIRQERETEKLKEKLETSKAKRKIQDKLG